MMAKKHSRATNYSPLSPFVAFVCLKKKKKTEENAKEISTDFALMGFYFIFCFFSGLDINLILRLERRKLFFFFLMV